VGETAFQRRLPQRRPGRPRAERGPRPHHCPRARQGPMAWALLAAGTHAAGTGRPSLHSIVFLNAFMNNSERKYYSLAGGQGPARCCSVGLGAAKANTLPAPLRFSPVFQINRCLPQRVLRPRLPDLGGHGPFASNVAGYSQHGCRHPSLAQAPTTAPLPLGATLQGAHTEHSLRAPGPQQPQGTVCPSELPQCFLPGYTLFHFEQKPLPSLGGRKIKAVSPRISVVGLWEGAPREQRAMPGEPP